MNFLRPECVTRERLRQKGHSTMQRLQSALTRRRWEAHARQRPCPQHEIFLERWRQPGSAHRRPTLLANLDNRTADGSGILLFQPEAGKEGEAQRGPSAAQKSKAFLRSTGESKAVRRAFTCSGCTLYMSEGGRGRHLNALASRLRVRSRPLHPTPPHPSCGGLNEAMLAGGDPAGPFADRNQPCDASTPIFTRP